MVNPTGNHLIVASSEVAGLVPANYTCDGIADEVEIQAALDQGPGLVELVGHTFNAGGLRWESGRVLKGQGIGATKIRLKNGVSQAEADAYGGCILRTFPFDSPAQDIGLFDLTLDGNKDNQTVNAQYGVYTMLGVYLKACQNAVIERINVQNCLSGGIYVEGYTPTSIYPDRINLNDIWLVGNGKVIANPAGGTWPVRGGLHVEIARRLKVHNCWSVGNLGDGYNLRGYDASLMASDIVLRDCHSVGNGTGASNACGFQVNQWTRDIRVEGCDSEGDTGYGFKISSPTLGQPLDDISLDDCSARNTIQAGSAPGYGLFAQYARRLRVHNTHARNCAQYGFYLLQSDDLWLSESGQRECGKPLRVDTSYAPRLDDVYGVGTTGAGADGNGITIVDCNRLRLRGALARNNGYWGVYVVANAANVDDVSVSDLRAYDDRGTKVQAYGLVVREYSGHAMTNVNLSDSDLRENLTGGLSSNLATAPVTDNVRGM